MIPFGHRFILSGEKSVFSVRDAFNPREGTDLVTFLDTYAVEDGWSTGKYRKLLLSLYPDTFTAFQDRFPASAMPKSELHG
jgi:hypothetical protein